MGNNAKTFRRQEMFALVEECLASGEKKMKFCRERGIRRNTFYYWENKYHKAKQEAPEGFLPVEIKGSPIDSPMEIEYPNGVRLKLAPGTNLSLLRLLITL